MWDVEGFIQASRRLPAVDGGLFFLFPLIAVGLMLVSLAAGAEGREIHFAGMDWKVRSGSGGPGPNQWSDSRESVWVDGDGLHLKIRNVDGAWQCAEVTSVLPTRRGMHRFYVASPVVRLDKNVVASPFIYQDDTHEVDIEFSTWQKGEGGNAQYVVQPYQVRGNLYRFEVPQAQPLTTHYFDWRPDSIRFKSFIGHSPEPERGELLLQEWAYTGKDNPSACGGMHVHINLWLIRGQSPSDGKEVEFVVKDADLPAARFRERTVPEPREHNGNVGSGEE